jgi:hypothetical protein
MRRLNSDTLQFDDVKSTATKDLELGAFNAADQCARVWVVHVFASSLSAAFSPGC